MTSEHRAYWLIDEEARPIEPYYSDLRDSIGRFYDDFRAIPGSANMPVAGGLPTASEGIPELQPVHGGDMAEFKLGFLDKALELGEAVVGVPVMDQASIPLGDGRTYTLQLTTKGQMVYTEGGQPLFLPAYFPLA